MVRKVPAILFVLVLLLATLNPGLELHFPAQTPDLTLSANSGSGAAAPFAGSDSFQGSAAVSPLSEPTPDPEPTPKPTATPRPTPEPTPIVKGTEGGDVKTLQGQLLTLGFMTAEPDGIYGKETEEGVKAFQEYLNQVESDKNPVTSAPTQEPEHDPGVALADEAVSDPTPVPGPYPVTGEADNKVMTALREGAFPLYRETGLSNGYNGSEAERLQSRLNSLQYIYKNIDGAFGAKTEEALKYFQKINGLPETGVADQNTLNAIYSPMAIKSDRPLHPYMAVVDVSEQRVYILAWRDGEYNLLLGKTKCSTGKRETPTPFGMFQDTTGPGNRWHYFKDFNCWAQFAYYIQGDILFHSVLYSKRDTRTLRTGSRSALGTRASHGCVRLAVKDAKWIWTNMPAGTPVLVRN